MRRNAIPFGLVLLTCALIPGAGATTYYVSSSGGNDSNSGTSPASAWKTFGGAGNHINAGAFSSGDVINLKRGDTWNEQLIPPSSGASGNPISFDAYGSGAAPLITAAAPIPFVSGSWSYVSGSTWKATLSSTISTPTVNLVQFGNLYGRKQSGGSCAAVIANKYDWCLTWPYIYVYSPPGTNPVTTYGTDGSIVPIMAQPAGLQMISINGRTWLTFQHIKIQTFDYMGVSVAGASDNLVFANMESDGMVPYGTTPHGFYLNTSGATNIQLLNDDAHLNFDGFRFEGTATAITVINCRGYANRDAGLRDYTGHVTYSHSHFYGNNIAQLVPGDVVGGIAGSGNISSSIAPVVTNFNTYPARFSFTVDDVGSSPGTEAYVDTLPAVFAAHGTGTGHFNVAVVPSYPVVWSDVNSWYAAGNEIDSHSWSHQYYSTNTNPQGSPPYPNAPALDIQYTGSGTAATLTISGNPLSLSTTVTGAPADNIPSINLTTPPNNTLAGLATTLIAIPHYTVTYDTSGPLVRPNTHTVNLLNVASVDIKTSSFVLLYDQTKLEPDEMASSKSAIQASVPGLTEVFYVYPDGIEDFSTEADAVAAGYTGARGSLAMKDQSNNTAGANSLYSNGVNVQNLTSLGAISFHGMTEPEIDSLVATLVFRASAWGAPYGLFTHYNSRGDYAPDISNTELGYLLDSITAHGGLLMTNAALVSAVTSGTNFSGTTRYAQNSTGAAVNLAVPTAGSPTVAMGSTTAYPIDINGVSRSLFGAWDVGAASYVSQRYGTGSGAGPWTMWPPIVASGPVYYSAYTGQDPIQWPSTIPNIGGLTNNGAQVTDTSYPSGTPATLIRCTDANSVPGYANTGYSAGAGGSGDGILFDASSSMLHLNYAAQGGIVLMNPATGVCNSSFITRDLDLTNPGPSNQPYAFGSGAFSISTAGRWIANGSTTDTSSATEVDAYTINPANGQFTHAPIADLAYGLPINGNAPAWQAGQAYAYGAYVSYTLTGGLATYALNTAYSVGDIVQPTSGNPSNCAFKVTVAGTTNTTTAPTWGSTCGTGTLPADGSVTWKGIGGPASFVFQNVSASGTSGGSAPTFLNAATATTRMPGGHPDLLSTILDNGITWENVGVNVTAQWNDFASAGTNDAYITAAISTDTYGPGTGGYAQWNGGQGTGIFVVQYDAAANTYHLVNTATLIFTDFVCPSAYTGYDCSGHAFTQTVLGQSTASGCETYIHNAKAMDGNAVIVMQQSVIGGTTCAGGKGWVWAPHQSFNASTQFQELLFEPNHWAVMHNNLFAMTNAGYSVNAGVSSVVMPLSTPVLLPPVDWVRFPCSSSTTPPYPIPPCNASGKVDSHLGAAAGMPDTFPTAGTMFNLTTNSPIEFMAWQGEEIAVSTTPTTTSPGSGPLMGSNVWRFTHTFATGSNPVFSAQWAISQFSQDGKFLAFTTDWNGQLGSTDGLAPTVANGELAVNPPAGVTYTCLGAQVWLPSTVYATGALVGPIGATSGSGAIYHVYQATTGGTSGTVTPSWSTTDPLGTTVSDGGITWNDRGPGHCRSDVVIARLPLAGQLWSGILDPTRATDWTKAGVQGGIPNYTNICQTVTASGDATGATDATAINSALSTCAASASSTSPQVVLLNAGTYYSKLSITPPLNASYLVLRGNGPKNTIIKWVGTSSACASSGGVDLCFQGNNNSNLAGTNAWLGTNNSVGTYTQGASVLDLGSTSSITAGMILQLTQRADAMGLCPGYNGSGGDTRSGSNCNGQIGITDNGGTVTVITSAPYPSITNGALVYIGPGNQNHAFDSCGNHQSGPAGVVASSVTTTATNTTFTYTPNYTPLSAPGSNCNPLYASVDTGGVYMAGINGGNILQAATAGTQCKNSASAASAVCQFGEESWRSMAEPHLVTAVCTGAGTGSGTAVAQCLANNEIVIDGQVILPNYRTSQAPGVWWTASGANQFAQFVGVENLTVDSTNDTGAASTIKFFNVANFWVNNVRSINPASFAVFDAFVTRGTIQNSYWFGGGTGPNHYAIDQANNTSYVLVQNNIVQHILVGLQTEHSAGSVYGYNYLVDENNGISLSFVTMFSLNHGFSGAMLAEGNDSPGCHTDNIHGTSWAATWFRDRCRGQDTPARKANLTSFAFQDSPFNRAENALGNVLGTAGQEMDYVQNAAVPVFPPEAIYWINAGGYIEGGIVGQVGMLDPLVGSTLLRWGNCDVATGTCRWAGNSWDTAWTTMQGVIAASYSSGGSITGSAGQNCLLTFIGGGGTGATGWIALSGTNAISGAINISSPGINYTSAPTSATLSTGSAALCTGAITVTSTVGSGSEIPATGVAYVNGSSVPGKGDTGAGQGALPASFYLSARPIAWWFTPFGTPPWPAIGPDVAGGTAPDGAGGYSSSIPAQLCYNNTPIDLGYQQTFTVTAASWVSTAGGEATFTATNSLAAGETVNVSTINPSGYNGTWQVASATSTSVTVYMPMASSPGTYVSGGSIGYPNILAFDANSCYGP